MVILVIVIEIQAIQSFHQLLCEGRFPRSGHAGDSDKESFIGRVLKVETLKPYVYQLGNSG